MDFESLKSNQRINEIVQEIATMYRNALSMHRATGEAEKFEYIIETPVNQFIVYFDLVDYWEYIEYGRRPGKMPPISAIENWIRVKPIIPDSQNGKVPDTRQLAFLIARKIGEEGTRGYHDLENTLAAADPLIEEIKEEIIKEIMQFIEDGLYS